MGKCFEIFFGRYTPRDLQKIYFEGGGHGVLVWSIKPIKRPLAMLIICKIPTCWGMVSGMLILILLFIGRGEKNKIKGQVKKACWKVYRVELKILIPNSE